MFKAGLAVILLAVVIWLWVRRPRRKVELKSKVEPPKKFAASLLDIDHAQDVKVLPVEPGKTKGRSGVLFTDTPEK